MDHLNQDYLATIESTFEKYTLLEEAKFAIYEALQTNTKTKQDFIENCFKLSYIAEASNLNSTLINKKTALSLLSLVFTKGSDSSAKTKLSFEDFDPEAEDLENELKVVRARFVYDHSLIYVDCLNDLVDPDFLLGKSSKPTVFSTSLLQEGNKALQLRLKFFKLRKLSLLRDGTFRMVNDYKKAKVSLVTVDSLVGSTTEQTVFGILYSDVSEKFYIQDEYCRKELNLRETSFGDGFFFSGCCVIAQGRMINDKFKVRMLIQPPQPCRIADFREKYRLDSFGAIFKAFLQEKQYSFQEKAYTFPGEFSQLAEELLEEPRLENIINGQLENVNFNFIKSNVENYFVVVASDVDLTSSSAINGIERMMSGYATNAPLVLVLMGNFTPETGIRAKRKLKESISKLSAALKRNPYFCKEGTLLLIGGPRDGNFSETFFPFRGVLKQWEKELSKTVNVIAASNPSRMVILGKQFVFFRSDFHLQLSKSALNHRNMSFEESSYHYFMTLLHQGRLLPLEDQGGSFRELDPGLHILPNPDYLICSDTSTANSQSIDGTTCINTGPFGTNASFTTIYPRADIVRQQRVD